MWRLRVGEGSAKSPWLRSTNGFLGRAVWEFDPDLGTPEEHAEVERLRRDFTDHRFERRNSADLLMRMQFAKQQDSTDDGHGRRRPHHPPQLKKIEEHEQVTEETVLNSLRRALDHFSSLQSSDGHWPGDFSGITIVGPTLIIALYVTRSLDVAISPEHRREMCRYIYNHQVLDLVNNKQIN